ncbi:DUF3298 domain-containing protein [Hymenobacter taeanensis]|uniref:DUF3298 domain-containing protein n=1 Tax=Hymenobacter taeanensis TaxID=2735321 RepID=A0A6M6BC32_9BACT|nr:MULTISPECIES: DUF3298 and DUF4163 domain-containing protein [Hymenobacter]QJX45717.1 DUF3298 domain-containing protein [Hymenobacter taeanensis]UOQ79557.1 DUF3298 and DUF4163 domain-containing protein [Hymenobacter sp. 5414T-23]
MSYQSRILTLAAAKSLAAIGGLGLLLTACQSDSGSSTASTTAATITEKQPTATPTDSEGAWYRQYRALLPGSSDSISLHLQSFGKNHGDFTEARLWGFYAAADGQPHEVSGTLSSSAPDSITLRTIGMPTGEDSQEGPVWRLQRTGTMLVGTQNGRPVQLRLVQPARGIRFVTRTFADSVPARPNHPEDSIFGRTRLHALLPQGGTARQTLQQNLLRGLRGDTLETKPAPTLEAVWQQKRNELKDYQQEVGPLVEAALADTSSSYRPAATLNYETEADTYVLWNQGNLLSIGYFTFDYSGGAHGNYGTTVRSYDTRTGRALHYTDIFRPGSEMALERLLGQYAKPVLGLKPGQPLSNSLFKNTLPATHNVYLTSGGAVFVYAPYEVASYAQGEIRVFMPFSALQPLLQPGLPVANGVEVVRK